MNHVWRRNLARLRAFFRKEPLDRELDAELASHLHLAEDDLIARGVPPTEARRQARLQLGGLGAVREHQRETRSLPFLDVLQQDLRLAFRSLGRDRGFTVVAVLVLALGIGATATVFSVVDAVLLEPLPFAAPQELTWISNGPENAEQSLSGSTSSSGVFMAWRERNRSFDAMSGYFAFFNFDRRELLQGDQAVRLTSVPVEQSFFELLGLRPHLGRFFVAEEALVDGPRAVVLSHNLWKHRFRADGELIGQTLNLDGEPVTVVGVLPESFDFASVFTPGNQVDIFTPLNLERIAPWGNTLSIVGRLRPGVTPQQAHQELVDLTAQLKLERQDLGSGYGSHVVPLSDYARRSTRRGLFFLLACVAAVLVIASANIAGLQLGRAAKRRQEFAVRAALGAGRARLLRQLITEGMVLATVSALLGSALAYLATGIISRLPNTSLPLVQRVQLDGTTLLCILAATLLVGLVCGLTPILQASFSRLQDALRDASRGSSGDGWQKRTRSALVVTETALACMLLIAATLLIRSFSQILDVDLGFQPQHALTLNVEPDASVEGVEARMAYFERLRQSLSSLPGIEAVGFTDALPLDRNRSWGVAAKGQTFAEDEGIPAAFVSRVDAELFDALGITLLRGRRFTDAEAEQNSLVVLINQSMADAFWPGQDPIGKEATIGLDDRTVIGVVSDVHHRGVESATGFDAYLPIGLPDGSAAFDLVIRTALPPDSAKTSVLAALRGADSTLPTDDLRPMTWFVDRAVSSRRFVASLLSGFALFAVVLASLGIYGVIAYATNRRSREIGIRMALGATAQDIQRGVLRDTLMLSGLGVLIGAVGGIVLATGMRSLLFEISPADPVSFVAMLAAMAVVTLAAGLIPARRAARIQPASTLRAG